MKRLLMILLALVLTGCATVTPNLADNPLSKMVDADVEATIAWVNGPEGPTDPLLKFQALACPTALKLAKESVKKNTDALQALLEVKLKRAQEIADGSSPQILLALTKMRYSPEEDIDSKISQLEKEMYAQITAVADNCRQVIPAHQLRQLAQFAAGLAK